MPRIASRALSIPCIRQPKSSDTMKVSTLIETLEGISPDAEVKLIAKHNPQANGPADIGSGAPVYIAVTSVDGSDKLVALSNYVVDQSDKPIFDVAPQFKRFQISSGEGALAAAADLSEQASREPTKDLEVHLEVERLKRSFRQLEDLLKSKEDN